MLHCISPNIQLSWIKRFSEEQNKSRWRLSTGLQGLEWITVHKIWFIDRQSGYQTCHSCKFLTSLAVICLFSSYFFASLTFGVGFFQFQDNKVSLKQVLAIIMKTRYFSQDSAPFSKLLICLLKSHFPTILGNKSFSLIPCLPPPMTQPTLTWPETGFSLKILKI